MDAEIIIEGGSIVDGTGSRPYCADLAIQADRIADIGDLSHVEAQRRICAKGRFIAPGFIDVHTHDDRALISTPDMIFKISQGVTTVVTGNCGISVAPLHNGPPPMPIRLLGGPDWDMLDSTKSYVSKLSDEPPAINSVTLVGHTTLRIATMDRLDRPATNREMLEMERLVAQSMEDGCIGFSTGLEYPPAIASSTEEVIHLAKCASRLGGIYTTHMRNENNDVDKSIDETVKIADEANIRTVISHHKTCGKRNWGRTRETLRQITEAQKIVELALDVYPYTASSKPLDINDIPLAEQILLTWCGPYPELAGAEFREICNRWGVSTGEAVERLSPAGANYFQIDEEDLRRILVFPTSMIGSDGMPGEDVTHPRLWGTFPRILGQYCRELKLFSIEKAIEKMTGLPAQIYRLKNRGLLKKNMFADIVIFDPETVIDNAQYHAPEQLSSGIDQVFVNGQSVYSNREWSGKRPGRLITLAG